jgi:transcription initiation factor IIE alpha subunit
VTEIELVHDTGFKVREIREILSILISKSHFQFRL